MKKCWIPRIKGESSQSTHSSILQITPDDRLIVHTLENQEISNITCQKYKTKVQWAFTETLKLAWEKNRIRKWLWKMITIGETRHTKVTKKVMNDLLKLIFYLLITTFCPKYTFLTFLVSIRNLKSYACGKKLKPDHLSQLGTKA